MAIFVLTLHVRKTRKCHRRVWKAHWQIPDVTRPELKVRERPIFFLTLHVGKTGSSETGKGSGKTGLGSATEGPESRTGRQVRKIGQESRTGRQNRKAGQESKTGRQVRKTGPERQDYTEGTGKWDLKAKQEGRMGEEDGKAMRFEGKV